MSAPTGASTRSRSHEADRGCGPTEHGISCLWVLASILPEIGFDLHSRDVPRDRCLSPLQGGIPPCHAGPPPEGACGGLEGSSSTRRVVLLLRNDFFASGALEARATGTDLGAAAGALVLAGWVADS